MNVYSIIIHSSEKLKTIQMSLNGNKQMEIHPYNGILLNNIKKQTIDTHNVNDSQSIILSKRSQSQKTTH